MDKNEDVMKRELIEIRKEKEAKDDYVWCERTQKILQDTQNYQLL